MNNKTKTNKYFGNGARVFGARKEKNYLFENLAVLTSSGMDIASAFRAVQEELRSKSVKAAVERMTNDIVSGLPIWKAFERSRMFPEHIIALVRLGEQSGKLSENLLVIVNEREKDRLFRSRIQSGMLYPSFVLLTTTVFGIVISWFILPRLSTMFTQLDLDLPIFTRVLIAIGEVLKSYGYMIVPALLALIAFATYFLFFHQSTKKIGQAILFAFPGVQKLMVQVSLSRMGYVLGTLLGAGLPIVNALQALTETTTIHKYRRWYGILANGIENGYSFGNLFSKYRDMRHIIPLPVQQMIIAGEQSGKLPETLLKIGKLNEEKTETTTKNMTVLLEPILLVIVWFGVVFLGVSIIMPIYGLIGGIGEQTSSSATGVAVDDQERVAQPLVSPVPSPKESDELNKQVAKTLIIINPTDDDVNIRSAPSLSGRIIAKVQPGVSLTYLQERDGWYEIRLDETMERINDEEQQKADEIVSGWINGAYIERVEKE